MKWRTAGGRELALYFELENVWVKNWERIEGERALILEQDTKLELAVWQAVFNGKMKKFAADEVSNGIWVFSLPEL